MQPGKAQLDYTFGQIGLSVEVNGNVDRPTEVVNHLVSALTAATCVQVIHQGISSLANHQQGDATRQKCAQEISFGEITVKVELNFDLNHHVSKRQLNDMVFTYILPEVSKTAGIYFGDNQPLTTPQAPLPQRPKSEISDSLGTALGTRQAMTPPWLEADTDLLGDRSRARARQLA